MKLSTSSTRYYILLLFFFLFTLFTAQVTAQTLEGIVRGRGGAPKQYVRVEMYGPENKVAFTDQDGRFLVQAQSGNYTVHVIERNRVMRFRARVPGRQEFILKWR